MAQGPQRRTAPQLQQTVVREFQGGWNTIDNELNLSPKFAHVLDNWMRAADGSMQVRYGYEFYADCGLEDESGEVLLTTDIINGVFFQGYLIVVDANGVIARVSSDNTGIRIWDDAIAATQPNAPTGWGVTNFVNFYSFGGKLILLNGSDKPLQIDNTITPICQYLVDPASGSNFAIPIASIGISDVGYSVLAGNVVTPTQLDISAKLESGVYSQNLNPDDAVSIDLSKITSTVNAAVTGLGVIRGSLVITYEDGLTIATLGITTTATDGTVVHTPSFDDGIALSGCVSQRTIVSLGNDMFLCDRVGVPSISRSSFGTLIPDRVSQYIEPELQSNISRLNTAEVANKIFAVFNPRERQYMLFMPKFTADTIPLPVDPITLMAPDNPNGMIFNIPNHNMDEGDQFTISGAIAVGMVDASVINTNLFVSSIVDKDNVLVNFDYELAQVYYNGGGPDVVLSYPNIETIGYIFTYNPKLQIQAWARFRGLKFAWGTSDIPGRVYFGNGRKVYRFGTVDDPISADRVNDYDVTWTNATQYNVGDLVLDTLDQVVFECLVANTSINTGTFDSDRAANPDNWVLSNGVPINFAWEWPWGDFGARANIKAIRGVKVEAQGTGEFTLNVFVDNLYKNRLDGTRTPVRSITFEPNEAGGFGAGTQPYGGGRRTREQKIWPIPVNCNTYKLRFEGSTTEPLRVVSVSLLYHKGGLAR